jgi:putative flippase GtrA
MMAQFRSREFATFLVTGGVAALVNFGSRIVLSQWLTFPVAVAVAYLIGMATAFALAKLFVFSGGRQSIPRSAAIFVLVNAVAVLQTWGISMLLAYYLLPGIGVRAYVNEIAHAVGVVVPVFTSFLGHKRWSFR